MNKNKRQNLILELLHSRERIKVSDVLDLLQKEGEEVERTTIFRDFKELIAAGNIVEIAKWIYEKKVDILEYFAKPFFEREKKKYNFSFLWSYIPNETSFLWEKYDLLKKEYLDKSILSTYDYKTNIRGIENLIIDLSFSSSQLEGNTYSYLDTEVLVKYNNTAEGKSQKETQMILNHKDAIKYIIDNRNVISLSKREIQDIHTLLAKWLIIEEYYWRVRDIEVTVWSAYTPLDNHFQLEEQFDIFIEKINQIRNPFEQALFILVFIPYFQLFMDLNKRTSRLSCNIPLIKNWLMPFSFLQINGKDYINAVLAIYELNNVDLMRDLFVNNYLLHLKRYL